MYYGTAEAYRVFVRSWWRENPTWPGGLEPGLGRRTTIARNCTYDEAKSLAYRYNLTHKPGRLSRKAEFDKYPVVQRLGTAPDGQSIAGDIVAYATTEANASLIAQAPAMLTIIREYLAMVEHGELTPTPYEGDVDKALAQTCNDARTLLRAVEGG